MPAPALGVDQVEGGLGAVGLQDSRVFDAFHRNRERGRMNIPDEPQYIRDISVEKQVYIYNVGPREFHQNMASYGTKYISGLAEDMVLSIDKKHELAVAGPHVVSGAPREFYPMEGPSLVLYHSPKANDHNSKNPAMHFANEILGLGKNVNKMSDITVYGVFSSLIPEQKRPAKDAGADAWALFKTWESSVRAAQKKLREKCIADCNEANIMYSRGKFNMMSDANGGGNDPLYQSARILKATELEYPWLKGSGVTDSASPKECWSCYATLNANAMKCRSCGELQVSPAEFEAEKKRRSEL